LFSYTFGYTLALGLAGMRWSEAAARRLLALRLLVESEIWRELEQHRIVRLAD